MAPNSNENELKFEIGIFQADPQQHWDFWGDDFNWTALLPVVWRNIESPGLSVRPVLPKKSEGNSDLEAFTAASYWSAAIHLLGLGLGWTNIGEGLRHWRESGYRQHQHPILDFVEKSYGKDIYSLELYFATEARWGIAESLVNMSDLALRPNAGPTWMSLDYDWRNVGYLKSLNAKSRRLAEKLLEGGTDPLHLEPHVTDSFRQRDLENTSQRVTHLGESKFLVKYSRYAGWAHNLAREIDLKSMFRSGLDLETEVRVELENFGPLGRFCYSNESGRWFLYSDRYGAPSLQIDAHRWGNPL